MPLTGGGIISRERLPHPIQKCPFPWGISAPKQYMVLPCKYRQRHLDQLCSFIDHRHIPRYECNNRPHPAVRCGQIIVIITVNYICQHFRTGFTDFAKPVSALSNRIRYNITQWQTDRQTDGQCHWTDRYSRWSWGRETPADSDIHGRPLSLYTPSWQDSRRSCLRSRSPLYTIHPPISPPGPLARLAFYLFVLLTGPIYKISYDLSYDCRKFIVRSTYDSDLKRVEISLRNIVS